MPVPISSPQQASQAKPGVKRVQPDPLVAPHAGKRQRQQRRGTSTLFSALNLSHPLGIKPLGNSFLSSTNARSSLGLFSPFSDELILHLLSYLDAFALINLERTCHALHVFANHEPLWKDLFLKLSKTQNQERGRRRGRGGGEGKGKGGELQLWKGSWKKTFIFQFHGPELRDYFSTLKDESTRDFFRKWEMNSLEPIQTPDFFSDVLFHPFRMSFSPLSPFYSHRYPNKHNQPSSSTSSASSASSRHNPIPRISTDDYSVSRFNQEFTIPGTPCIIQPSTDRVPGRNYQALDWTFETMLEKWSKSVFRAEAIKTDLSTYVDYSRSCENHFKRGRAGAGSGAGKIVLDSASDLDSNRTSTVARSQMLHSSSPSPSTSTYDVHAIPDDSPFYLFDSSFPQEMDKQGDWLLPDLLEFSDIKPGEVSATGTETENQADIEMEMERERKRKRIEMDLFDLLGDQRPEYRWIIAGPERSGSGWHKDPNSTSAWNTPLVGRKAWLLLPPHIVPPGIYVSSDESEVTAPLSIAEWMLGFYEETLKKHGPVDNGGDGCLLEGVCQKGETVYVPRGWWHAVINLEECIALTQNFISRSELPSVLYFFKHKPDQVSGFQKTKDKNKSNRKETETEMDQTKAQNQMESTSGSESRDETEDQEEEEEEGAAEDDNDNDEEDEDEDEDESFSGLYELFSSRLKDFDLALWQEGMKGLERLESEANQRSFCVKKTKHSSASGGSGTWWENLKKSSSMDSQTRDQAGENADANLNSNEKKEKENENGKTEFSFGLERDLGDELDEVPW